MISKNVVVTAIVIFNNRNKKDAIEARNEIARKWGKLGSWVGQGSDITPKGECDVQSEFKRKDVGKAIDIAINVMQKYNVSGRYMTKGL